MKKTISTLLASAVILSCQAAENYAAVHKTGVAAQNKRDYAAAIAAYRKAATLSNRPNDKYSCAYKEYECLRAQQKYDESIGVMQKSLKIEKLAPSNRAEAIYLCGISSLMKKDNAAAEKYFVESGKIGEGWSSARSLSTLGSMYVRQKKYAEAEKCFQEALKRSDAGSKIDSWTGLSQLYEAQKKSYEEVLAPLLEAEKFVAKDSDLRKLTVMHYKSAAMARYRKSDEALAEVMKIKNFKNPQKDWGAAIYSTGAQVAYYQKKDTKLAKELIDSAAALKPAWGLDKNLQKKLANEK